MRFTGFLFVFLFAFSSIQAAQILIPMDNSQKNHLKAYGIAYWILEHDIEVEWLLNYRGGSFMCVYSKTFENECIIR
ncbi:MAG: asparagine synthetase B, partial [Bacteroidia bacterium]|nr:asparagine synthetase B [Bacteroidia bacterium]